jgi:preprotein translocase subunit SecG
MTPVTHLVPLLTGPIISVSIVLIIASLLLTLAILVHKGRGGGMSDLFGGGMSTSLGGSSIAERNLDRATIVVGLVWVVSIVALLLLYGAGAS